MAKKENKISYKQLETKYKNLQFINKTINNVLDKEIIMYLTLFENVDSYDLVRNLILKINRLQKDKFKLKLELNELKKKGKN